MVTYGDVRRWNAEGVAGIADDLRARVDRLVGLQDEISAAANIPGWQGPAADAAGTSMQGLTVRLEEAVTGVAAVQASTADVGRDVAELHRRATDLDAQAGAAGLLITDDGRVLDAAPLPVVPTPAPAGAPADPQLDAARAQAVAAIDARTRAREQLAGEVERLLDDAIGLDARYSATLEAASRGELDRADAPGLRATLTPLGLDGARSIGAALGDLDAAAPTTPAMTAPPAEIAQWFAGLSPAQREAVQQNPANWALLGGATLLPAAVRARADRDGQAAEFRRFTGTDPSSANDWRTAAMLYNRTGARSPVDPSAQVKVVRINPVPGAGVVTGSAFISSPEVSGWPPLVPETLIPGGRDDGDNRGFDPNAGPGRSRAAFQVDYDRGLVVVRQNPTHTTDGSEADVASPRIGVEQNPAGEVRVRLDAENPLTPGPNEPPRDLGWTVRSDMVVTPGPDGAAAMVNGRVSQYPSWEVYHHGDDGSTTPIAERPQNSNSEDGPFMNLPRDPVFIGPDPRRIDQWAQVNHGYVDLPNGGDPWRNQTIPDTPDVTNGPGGAPIIPRAGAAR